MSAAPVTRPNVLLITTDQQRYDSLGVLGNPLVRTPHLDALAARGTVFRHGYIQNPVCMPSRASIMTGRYVHQHGVDYMEHVIATSPGLPPWEVTIQERLRSAGYTTAAFGKIHQLPPRGWDQTALTMGKGARWRAATDWAHGGAWDREASPFGPDQLGPVYAEWLERKRPGAYESIYRQRQQAEYRDQATAVTNVLAADEYVDYWIGENTWRYLEDRSAESEQPFFLWCGFCGPHGPFDPPEPYASMYDPNKMPVSPTLHARQRNVPGRERPGRFDREDGETLARKITAYYWGMVTCIDDMMGRIMDTLTRRGLWENTLVIFTTDHGEMLGDFGALGKGNFTEPVIRAPYIMVPPTGAAVASPGEGPHFVNSLVEHIDLAPTILDYAGMAQPSELPGMSLRAALESTAPDPVTKPAILCEYTTNDRERRSKCLRTDRFKLVFTGADEPFHLFDLEEDPLERENVAAEPRYREVVERHVKLLLDRLQETELTAWNTRQYTGQVPTPERDEYGRLLPG